MNKIVIIGNLTGTPELRVTQSGVSVCQFTVAVNGRRKDDGATFFRVTAWRALGETCHKYLDKGREVMVCGAVSASERTGRDGRPRASLEVTAEDVEFLSAAGDAANHAGDMQEAEHEQASTGNGFEAVETEDLPF